MKFHSLLWRFGNASKLRPSLHRSFTRTVTTTRLETKSWNRPFICSVGALLGGSFLFILTSHNSSFAESTEKTIEPKQIGEQKIVTYQERAQLHQSPAKSFNFFASVERNGELLMTPDDFIRSLHLPQPDDNFKPLEPTIRQNLDSVHLSPKTPQIFKAVDLNGDGLISYSEYLFFLLALSLPHREFEVAFHMMDENRSGTLDAREFAKVIRKLEGRSSVISNETEAINPDTVAQFIGKDGQLTFSQFEKFLNTLQDELILLEFSHSDIGKKGYLTVQEFGSFLINHSLRSSNINAYRKRANLLARDTTSKVTLAEFKEFYHVLNNLEEMQSAVKLFGEDSFTKQTLRSAAYAAADVDLSPVIVDAIFFVFDTDGFGTLPHESFVSVLRNIANRGIEEPHERGFWRVLQCAKSCVSR